MFHSTADHVSCETKSQRCDTGNEVILTQSKKCIPEPNQVVFLPKAYREHAMKVHYLISWCTAAAMLLWEPWYSYVILRLANSRPIQVFKVQGCVGTPDNMVPPSGGSLFSLSLCVFPVFLCALHVKERWNLIRLISRKKTPLSWLKAWIYSATEKGSCYALTIRKNLPIFWGFFFFFTSHITAFTHTLRFYPFHFEQLISGSFQQALSQ